MDAVTALYSGRDPALAAELFRRLSDAVFDGGNAKPAGSLKRALAKVTYAALLATTRSSKQTDSHGGEATVYRNWILSRTGHPYAKVLMTSSHVDHEGLVEGGDAMNGPYMMLVPELLEHCKLWDRLLLDSVQGRDVKARLVWETRAVYTLAKERLERGLPVRMKAIAAGTGLSLMLVCDRLLRDGFPPALISAHITDKDPANVAKSTRLLNALALAAVPEWSERSEQQQEQEHRKKEGSEVKGVVAHTEDIFSPEARDERFHIVTAIGILEYFHGSTASKTEDRLGHDSADGEHSAHDVIRALHEMTTDDGRVIVNCFKHDGSTRILELFGKRFDYRLPEHLRALMSVDGFVFEWLAGSGNIYDVEVYRKSGTR